MKEDILENRYNDPFVLDEAACDSIKGYEDMVTELSQKLDEDLNKLHRKRKEHQYDVNDVGEIVKVTPRRAVNVGTQPWDEDQSFVWPDYEAEAFEKELEKFRQRPESNTGYTNKALNDLMKKRWGKEAAEKCIKKPIKKESIQERFKKRIESYKD